MRRTGAARGGRPSPGVEEQAVAARRLRAVEEPMDIRLRAREPGLELEVRNPVHRTCYRVFFPTYPSRDAALCTCTDFARRGLGTCKHVEAAWDALRSGTELAREPGAGAIRPSAEVLWTEIDRRLVELERSRPDDIRSLERAGRPLIDLAEGKGEGRREEVGRGEGRREKPTSTSRAPP